MTVRTRHFDVLRRSFGRLSDDSRIQALVVAFCFGALLKALAGFGVPVAICSVMLVALGFEPVRAAVVALVADTAPRAFGVMVTPVVTLAQVTGLPMDSVAFVVGRQAPLPALVLPLVLVFLVDGRRGLRETWVPALVGGIAFAVGQFIASNYVFNYVSAYVFNYVSAQLADAGADLLGAGALIASWRRPGPGSPPVAGARLVRRRRLRLGHLGQRALRCPPRGHTAQVLPWNVGLLMVMCLIVAGQSSPALAWTLP